jgi:PilZ domain
VATRNGTFWMETGRKPSRRNALMTGTQREQRTAICYFVTVPVAIYADGVQHVGFVRNLSGKGIFVYSDFQPACGSTLRFTLRIAKNTVKHVPGDFRGRVVRVETTGLGAAIGIAVAVEEYEFRKLVFPLILDGRERNRDSKIRTYSVACCIEFRHFNQSGHCS